MRICATRKDDKHKKNQLGYKEKSTINRVVEKDSRIKTQAQGKKTTIPVKCVMKRHIQICLDARNLNGLFQDNQGDQIVHLKKFA